MTDWFQCELESQDALGPESGPTLPSITLECIVSEIFAAGRASKIDLTIKVRSKLPQGDVRGCRIYQ
jgi:hypothetical protein